MVGTMMLLLRYERYTITTLLCRRDGRIILVVAVSHRIRLEIFVGHHRRRLDSVVGGIQLDIVYNTPATFD